MPYTAFLYLLRYEGAFKAKFLRKYPLSINTSKFCTVVRSLEENAVSKLSLWKPLFRGLGGCFRDFVKSSVDFL